MFRLILVLFIIVLVSPAKATSVRARKKKICNTLMHKIDIQNLATIVRLREEMGWPELTDKQGLFLLKYWNNNYGIYSVAFNDGVLHVHVLRGPLAEFIKTVVREESLQNITVGELYDVPKPLSVH